MCFRNIGKTLWKIVNLWYKIYIEFRGQDMRIAIISDIHGNLEALRPLYKI